MEIRSSFLKNPFNTSSVSKMVLSMITMFQVFQGKIKRAMDLLEKFYNLTHSDGRASDGEEYPDHLKSKIELYVSLKEGDENNADKNDSVSSKSCQVQNNVIGNPAPIV